MCWEEPPNFEAIRQTPEGGKVLEEVRVFEDQFVDVADSKFVSAEG